MNMNYLKGFKAFDNRIERLKCQKGNEFGRDLLQAQLENNKQGAVR